MSSAVAARVAPGERGRVLGIQQSAGGLARVVGPAAALGLALGWSWPLLYLLPLVPVSVALAVVDWHTRILPSRLIHPAYLLVGVGVVVSWLLAGRPDGWSALARAAVGAAGVFVLFYLAWFVHPRGMGFGDVRLSGLLGLTLASLGWSELVVGLYAGFLLGGVLGGLLSLAGLVPRRGYPFGPFLVAGALVGVVLGRPVLDLLAS